MFFVRLYKCLHDIAPTAMNLYRSVSVIEGQSLRSTAREQLDVPHPKTSTYGRRAFSIASRSAWNSLTNYLKDSSLTLVMFKWLLKTFYFKVLAHWVHSRSLHVSALYKFTFTLHYGKNGCKFHRLIRLVFVSIGLFKSIKQWEQFPNYTLYKKKSILAITYLFPSKRIDL